jgi:hypothetical protein
MHEKVTAIGELASYLSLFYVSEPIYPPQLSLSESFWDSCWCRVPWREYFGFWYFETCNSS